MDSEDEAMDEEMDGIDDSDNMDYEDMDGELDDMEGEDDDDDLPELEPVGGSKGKNNKKDAKASNNKSTTKKGSAVDDEFFKLNELEKFLDDADVSPNPDRTSIC